MAKKKHAKNVGRRKVTHRKQQNVDQELVQYLVPRRKEEGLAKALRQALVDHIPLVINTLRRKIARRNRQRPPRPGTILALVPTEIRMQIWEEVLVSQEPLRLGRSGNFLPDITVSLLRTCRLIHTEAREVLFSKNIFDISDLTPGPAAWFLQDIGPLSAGFVTHLVLPFPVLHVSRLDKLSLSRESTAMMKTVWTQCSSLNSVTMRPVRASLQMEKLADATFINRCKGCASLKVLGFIDRHFKAMPQLTRVNLEIPEIPRHGLQTNVWSYLNTLRDDASIPGWCLSPQALAEEVQMLGWNQDRFHVFKRDAGDSGRAQGPRNYDSDPTPWGFSSISAACVYHNDRELDTDFWVAFLPLMRYGHAQAQQASSLYL